MNELPGLVDRDARLPRLALEDAGVPWAEAPEGAVSDCGRSTEVKGKGPIQGNYPGYLPGRQLLIAREARHLQQRRLRPQADYNM